MAKFLLSMAVALMATTAVAQAPSADELSKYSVRAILLATLFTIQLWVSQS